MQYNRITLKFSGADSHLENTFADTYFSASLNATRFTLLVGLIFCAAFGILDAILLPEVKQTIWLIRYAIVCPLAAFWIALNFYKGYKKLWQFSIITVISFAGIGIIFMIGIAPQPANFSYYAGLILVFIFCYTFFRSRFLWASITFMLNAWFPSEGIPVEPKGPLLLSLHRKALRPKRLGTAKSIKGSATIG